MSNILKNAVRYRERAFRFPAHLVVSVSTFGTKDIYRLETINISYTGLLLASIQLLPYQVKTIIEMTTELELRGERHTLSFIGKISRMAKGHSSGLQQYTENFNLGDQYQSVFGVSIIEISEKNAILWRDFVDNIQATLYGPGKSPPADGSNT